MRGNVAAESSGPSVFISYARADAEFLRTVVDELEQYCQKVWLDTRSLPPAEQWKKVVQAEMITLDAVVFLVSPASLESRHCRWEIAQAVAQKKRIVPLFYRDPDLALLTGEFDPVAGITGMWVPRDGWEGAMCTAVMVDWKLSHRQAELNGRAMGWPDGGRGRHLRGRELREAVELLAELDRHLVLAASDHQRAYVAESQRVVRRSRVLAGISAAMVTILLAGLGVYGLRRTQDAAANRRAQEAATLAERARDTLGTDLAGSLLLALGAVRKADLPVARAALVDAFDAAGVRRILPSTGARHVAASPDGSLLAVTAERDLYLWNLETGAAVWGPLELAEELQIASSVVFSRDGRQLFAMDSNRMLWRIDAATGKIIESREIEEQKGQVSSGGTAQLSRDGTQLIVSGIDAYGEAIDVVDVATFSLVARFEVREKIRGIDPLPGGEIMVGTPNGFIALDPLSKQQRDLSLPLPFPLPAAWCGTGRCGAQRTLNAAGTRVVSAGETELVLWDPVSGQRLATFGSFEPGSLRDVEFAPAGDRLVVTTDDNTIEVWDTSAEPTSIRSGIRLPEVGRTIFADPDTLVVTGSDIFVLDVTGTFGPATPVAWPSGLGAAVEKVALSPDGSRAAVELAGDSPPGGPRPYAVLEVGPGGAEVIWRGDADVMPAFSASGRAFVTSRNRIHAVWDGDKRRECRIAGQDILDGPAALAPGGDVLAVADGRAVHLCRLADQQVRTVEVDTDFISVQAMAFSADGSHLLARDFIYRLPPRWVQRVNVAEGRTDGPAVDLPDAGAVVAQPDGEGFAVVGGGSGRLVIDEFDGGPQLEGMEVETAGLGALAFSGDGSMLAALVGQASVAVLAVDGTALSRMMRFSVPEDTVDTVAFGFFGTRSVVTATKSGAAIWSVDLGPWRTRACEVLRPVLDHPDWAPTQESGKIRMDYRGVCAD
ncbi:hypothetical protein FRAHR75_280005 [Frankia sp. Hr75.2]|nr:hypothetical protein FRAHR75_280005 [Frankia sp. Hr75.2]